MANPTNLVTGVVRLSFANIFEPRASSDDAEPRYSAMLIIDKDDAVTLGRLKDAVAAAKERGKEEVWRGKVPATLKLPIRDGDAERPDSPELAGKYFMNVKSKNAPQVVKKEGGKLVPVTDPKEVYSGCFVKVSLNLYPFSFNGNNGVGGGLNNVFFVKDGEPLGGGSSSAYTDFADEADETEKSESVDDWMNG